MPNIITQGSLSARGFGFFRRGPITPIITLTADTYDVTGSHQYDTITYNPGINVIPVTPAADVTRYYTINGASSSTYNTPISAGNYTVTVTDTDTQGYQVYASLTFIFDNTMPYVSTYIVDSNLVILTYVVQTIPAVSLSTVTPVVTAFTVTGSITGSHLISSILADSTGTVTLTLSSSVSSGETITVVYNKPVSNYIQDIAGYAASNFSIIATNVTFATPTVTLVNDTTDGMSGHTTDKISTNINLSFSSPSFPAYLKSTSYVVNGITYPSYSSGYCRSGTNTVSVIYTDIYSFSVTGSTTFIYDTIQPYVSYATFNKTVAVLTYTTQSGVALSSNNLTTSNFTVTGSSSGSIAVSSAIANSANNTITLVLSSQLYSYDTITITLPNYIMDVAGFIASTIMPSVNNTTLAIPSLTYVDTSINGTTNTDTITTNGTVTWYSTTAQYATSRIFTINGTPSSPTTATATTVPSTAGTYNITVTDYDSMNFSATSGTCTFILDVTRPTVSTIYADSRTIILQYTTQNSGILLSTATIATSSFSVMVNGANPYTVNSVSILNNTVTLSLQNGLTSTYSVTVAYTKPITNYIQDIAGYASNSFNATSAINITLATPIVTLLTDSTDGAPGHNTDRITNNAALTFTSADNSNSIISSSIYTVNGVNSSTYTTPTSAGNYTVTIVNTDIYGYTSSSLPFTFTLSNMPPLLSTATINGEIGRAHV